MFQPDALSITRSRLLEVSYFVRVTVGVGSLSSEVSAQIPIRIVNFISIDPIPSFAPSQAMLHPKRHTASVEIETRRSRSMDDVLGSRFSISVFGSGVAAPGVGIIASDGTYRGDTTLHPIGRLEVRNFTPPEALMRRAAERQLQRLVLDPEFGADASDESRYSHDPATIQPVVADAGKGQRAAHTREPEICEPGAHSPFLGDSSIEGSQEGQQISPELEHGAIPLAAYSSTATQRMYNVSQEASPRRPLPNTSASAYPTDQHPAPHTSLPSGGIIDGNITSDDEVKARLDSVNPDDSLNSGALGGSGIEVDRGETPERQSNIHVILQEEPLRRTSALSRGSSSAVSPIDSISRSASDRRRWRMSQPLSTRTRQQSSVPTVASSMQSSRATSMTGGIDSGTSGSYSSHGSVPGPTTERSNPAQGQPAWSASAPAARRYPTPNGGRRLARTSQNIGLPVKSGPGGLVLQPRPLPTSRTPARRSMVEGGPRISTRTALGHTSPPPGPAPRPVPQQARSSDGGSANVSPSRKPNTSRLKTADLENKSDSTGPHPNGKPDLGEGTVSSAPQSLHRPTPSEDPQFIPPTVSALMRTDIQVGNVPTSTLRGPRPAPEPQPNRQLKGEGPLEGVSRSAPPLTRKWEGDNHLTYLQQLDTTPTAPSRARQSTTSTPSKALSLGPTSVKSRIAMLEEKTKALDNTSGPMMSGRWSVGTGISSGQRSVRPLSNSSAATFESTFSTYSEPGHVVHSTRAYEGIEEGTNESSVESGVV